MAKKKSKWKIHMFQGQVHFDSWDSTNKIHQMGEKKTYYDWEGMDENKKKELFDKGWKEVDSDYIFHGQLKFEYMNSSSASGRQFIFTDVETGLIYQMLPGAFTVAIKEAVKGVVTGDFGFEKIGSSLGVKLLTCSN